MLSYAEQNNNAPLAGAMRKLYTSWQDSIQTVKAAQKLTTLQQNMMKTGNCYKKRR